MSFRRSLLGILCSLPLSMLAQVTIPDAAFAAALEEIVPDAITGDQLDPDHATVTDLAVMILFNYTDISDLSGLEHFTALEHLDISSTQVTDVPTLPATLTFFRAVGVALTVLPDLPPSVTTLDLGMTLIEDFSPLPPALESLDISYTPLQTLAPLPASLYILLIDATGITELPVLPEGLGLLSCGENALTDLPDPLPPQLYHLQCTAQPITVLPELPSTLLHLAIDGTQITTLPTLPDGLIGLTCSQTPLTCLPPLPEGVDVFQCDGSLIECVPGGLPSAAMAFVLDFGYFLPPPCTFLHPDCAIAPYVEGSVFNDLDNDGVDDGEPLLPYAMLRIQPGDVLTSTVQDGHYRVHLPVGEYTVQAVPGPYRTVTTPPEAVELIDNTSIVTSAAHGLHVTPDVLDMRVQLVALAEPRPGFDMSCIITYSNIGSLDASGTVLFHFDPLQEFVSATPAPDAVNGNELTWNHAALAQSGNTSIVVRLHTPLSAALGMGTQLIASVSPMEDADPYNNFMVLYQTVVAAYDPNDKLVQPDLLTPAEVAAGQPLHYTIRFQNTGTAEALMVRISDTLDTRLLPGTFEFIASSHPCTWYVQDGVLSFLFADINLPDSGASQLESCGFVSFRMQATDALELGESVPNHAAIVFDHNAPVITAPVSFVVVEPGGVAEQQALDVRAFPVPARDQLQVVSSDAGAGTLRLMDLAGRDVLRAPMQGSRTTLDISTLTPGIYALHLRIGERERVLRILVQ